MVSKAQLAEALTQRFNTLIDSIESSGDMVTIEVSPENLLAVAKVLQSEEPFYFEECIDVCGVDYSTYGESEWRTHDATGSGFDRGQTSAPEQVVAWDKPRFASVIHLLSVKQNHRLRVRTFVDENTMQMPSVVDIWNAANWFERESFDLFGILYQGHPDLRRLLTDYGFIGHPFRKDFPLIGKVELRYDAKLERCVYEPVSIQPRTLVPRVIRDDSRYVEGVEPPKEEANG